MSPVSDPGADGDGDGDADVTSDGSARDATGNGRLSRRALLRAVGGASVGSLLLTEGIGTARAASDPWTVVALPDTQYFVNHEPRYELVTDQTDWIAENVDARNIKFVSHEGDLVHDAEDAIQWTRIDDAMSTLDGVVPYSTLPGNHDYADTDDRSTGLEAYTDYFGANRFEDYDWFAGTGPGDREANSYQRFSAGGYDFLHLAVEWEAPGTISDPDTSLGWAQQVLEENPDVPTILTTHAYLTDWDRDGGDDFDPGRPRFVEEEDGDGTPGEVIWRELVAPNPQVFMVLCGHFHSYEDEEESGEYHQQSRNAADQPVYEMLANYQGWSWTGYGRLRLLEFVPGGGEDAPDRIQVRTYSPNLDEYETGDTSKFAFDLDFESRFDPSSETFDRVAFQQGIDGYDGVSVTNLREADPESDDEGDSETVTVSAADPEDSDDHAQALVRFDDIVGDAEGQIPPNASVQDATLTVRTVEMGDGAAVHRLLTDWTDDDTWESFGGGVRADGTVATESAEAEAVPLSEGTMLIDVTESVQAWVGGEPNYGLALLPLGEDGWEFSTVEGERPPHLSVIYDATSVGEIPPGDVDNDGDVDEDDAELVQRGIANDDVAIDRSAADVDEDGDVDIVDVVEILNMESGG